MTFHARFTVAMDVLLFFCVFFGPAKDSDLCGAKGWEVRVRATIGGGEPFAQFEPKPSKTQRRSPKAIRCQMC